MSFLERLEKRLRREAFLTSPLSVVVNPFHITRSALHRHLRRLAPRLGGRILDFGCGSKPYASLFTQATRYSGVDIAASGHDHGNSAIDFFYDGVTLPFADGSWDAVVSFETLEHIFNPQRILSELHRVLRNDGRLLLSVPFVWDEHEIPYDFARYSSFGLKHLLETAGFEVLEQNKTTSYFLTVAQMLIAYLHQHVLPRRGLLRHVGQLLVVFPLTALSILFDRVLPKRHEFFCDNVVLARKRSLTAPAAAVAAGPP